MSFMQSLTFEIISSFPIFGLGSYFVLDGSLKVKGSKDIAMFGRLGGSNESRAETLAIL